MDEATKAWRQLAREPGENLAEIRRGYQRFLRHGVSSYRLLGFFCLGLVLYLYLRLLGQAEAFGQLWSFWKVALSYSLLAWLANAWFFARFRHMSFFIFWMTIDILVYLYAIYLSGGQDSWFFLVLIGRVCDQIYLGYRRPLVFSHLIIVFYVGFLLFLEHAEGRTLDWSMEWAKMAVLYGMSLYVSLTAIPAQRVKTRMRQALRSGQTLLEALQDKSDQYLKEKERAEEQNRIKDRFLANISHEVRTPINGIMGMSQLLKLSELTRQQKDYLNLIQFSGEALVSVIQDVLDSSKLSSGQLELKRDAFSMRSNIQGVVDLYTEKAYRKSLALWCYLDPALSEVHWGDNLRIRQIAMNLVSNGVKFTDQGRLEVYCLELSDEDLANPSKPGLAYLGKGSLDVLRYWAERVRGMKVMTLVRDTGRGIPSEKLEAIFQRFSQVDESKSRRFGGTGLGLALAKELVSLMGGLIGAESMEDRGSVFWFALTLGTGHRPVTRWREERAHLAESRFLLVDVEPDSQLPAFLHFYDMVHVKSCRFTELGAQIAAWEPRYVLYGGPMERALRAEKQCLQSSVAEVEFVYLSPPDIILYDQNQKGYQGEGKVIKHPLRYEDFLALIHGDSLLESRLEEEPSVEPPAGQERARQGPFRILIAEDNHVNRVVLERLLRGRGVDITCVVDGREALAAWRGQYFDVVLMDVHMPLMDGIEAAMEIRLAETGGSRRTPIIAVTASDLDTERERMAEAGMDGFISKPFNFAALKAELERLELGHVLDG